MSGTRGTWGRREVHVGFWWRNQRERVDSEDLCVNGRIIVTIIVCDL
jgi:hypothetical protein